MATADNTTARDDARAQSTANPPANPLQPVNDAIDHICAAREMGEVLFMAAHQFDNDAMTAAHRALCTIGADLQKAMVLLNQYADAQRKAVRT